MRGRGGERAKERGGDGTGVAPSRPRSLAPSRSRVLGSVLALAVLLGAWGIWRAVGHRSGASSAELADLEPRERQLREAAQGQPADAAAHRALGVYLLERRRAYEAMWSFQDNLDLRPDDSEARRGLARALILAGLPKRALEILADRPSSLHPLAPSHAQDVLEDRRVAAAVYLAMGDAESAVAILEAVSSLLGGAALALLDLGKAYEALGNDDRAGRAYRRHVQLQPKSLDGNLALARVAARRRSWGEVFPALATARAVAPQDPRPVYQYALALRGHGEGEGSAERPGRPIQALRQLLQSHPEFGPAYLHVGLWLLRQERIPIRPLRPQMAVTYLERALAARAGGEETRLQLATALEALGLRAEAAYQRGRYFAAMRQPQRALEEYRRMAALDPGRKDAPLLISTLHFQQGRLPEAEAAARRGLERAPEDPDLLGQHATLLLAAHDNEVAAKLCRRWRERDPKAAEPCRLLARIEAQALRFDSATRFAEEAMARDPGNAQYCVEAASALVGSDTPENLRRAAATLRRAIALDPRAAEAHLRLGAVLERLGDRDGARREYERCMDADRTLHFGAYSLSQICPRLGKAPRARFYAEIVRRLRDRYDTIDRLRRQLSSSPDDAEAHADLAERLLEAGDFREARAHLEQVVRLRPRHRKEERQLQILQRLLAMREG